MMLLTSTHASANLAPEGKCCFHTRKPLALLQTALLLGLTLLAVGCDAFREDDEPAGRAFLVQVEGRPAGALVARCTRVVVAERNQQVATREGPAPFAFEPARGQSISVRCHHTERGGALRVRIVSDGNVIEEETAEGAFASVHAAWPQPSGQVGSWGVAGTDAPLVYDLLTFDSGSNALLSEALYPNPSERLADTLRAGSFEAVGSGSGVFLSGTPESTLRVRLFTPSTWIDGTSLNHYDANTDGLMVPFLPEGRAFLDPTLTTQVLGALGWPLETDAPPDATRKPSSSAPKGAPTSIPAPPPQAVCALPFSPSKRQETALARDWDRRPKARSGFSGDDHSETDFAFVFDGPWPPEAKSALRAAAAQWSARLRTGPQIAVVARWQESGRGALASAGPTRLFRDFAGAPEAGVYYPAALANALSGEDLNGAENPEIELVVSGQASWHYGTSSTVPEDQTSFVTMALHELAHGLGFETSFTVEPPAAGNARAGP